MFVSITQNPEYFNQNCWQNKGNDIQSKRRNVRNAEL